MRKHVSPRLLAHSEGEIAALTASMRQLGVGSQGGAGSLAIFHQLLSENRLQESKSTKNFFGMTWCKAVREAASRFFPKHSAAAWKPRNLSHVEQEGPARERVAAQQASGSLPWIGVDDPTDEQRPQADHAARQQEAANFQIGVPEKLTRTNNPLHVLQNNEGLADKKGNCKFGKKCACKHTEMAWSEPEKWNTPVIVAKTLDVTQAAKKITSLKLIAMRDLLHGVSVTPVKKGEYKVRMILSRSSDCLVSQNDL